MKRLLIKLFGLKHDCRFDFKEMLQYRLTELFHSTIGNKNFEQKKIKCKYCDKEAKFKQMTN